MTTPVVVYPHEFFRIDFDAMLEEGERQERMLSANAGEAEDVSVDARLLGSRGAASHPLE